MDLKLISSHRYAFYYVDPSGDVCRPAYVRRIYIYIYHPIYIYISTSEAIRPYIVYTLRRFSIDYNMGCSRVYIRGEVRSTKIGQKCFVENYVNFSKTNIFSSLMCAYFYLYIIMYMLVLYKEHTSSTEMAGIRYICICVISSVPNSAC